MDRNILDELGLPLENSYVVAFIPATEKALVFRIVSRLNKGFEKLAYGPLPIDSGDTFYTLDGGTSTAPADGVIPARGYTPESLMFEPIVSGTYDTSDMWYTPTDPPWNSRLFIFKLKVKPEILRIQPEIPRGTRQNAFQGSKVLLSIKDDFGFRRGEITLIQFPGLHYGYHFCNDLNANMYTSVEFIYSENKIEIPKSAEDIFRILTRQISACWLTIPIRSYEDKVRTALLDAYGTEGFPLYGLGMKTEALREYQSILQRVKV